METQETEARVLSASREIAAGTGTIFELIADPAQQPRWDGNDNLAEAGPRQRVRGVGDVFTMTLTGTSGVRANRVVEFEEGRLIAWMPGDPGVNGLWEIRLGGLGFSGLAAISFPGWWPLFSPGGRGQFVKGITPFPVRASARRWESPLVRTRWAWWSSLSTVAVARVFGMMVSNPEGWMLLVTATDLRS